MKSALIVAIEEIRSNRAIATVDEASIKAGVVLRLLSVLGWNPFDITEVKPEFTVESKRVDFALRLFDANKVFIEAKRPNEVLDGHQQQLLEYSFKQGVRLAILTNGLTWWFYLPLNEGSWEERRFFSVDILQQEPDSVADRFMDLLSKANVSSGNALKNAEHLYSSKQKRTALRDTLPRALNRILTEPDSVLVDLVSDTVEKMSGFRPEPDDVRKFIKESLSGGRQADQIPPAPAPRAFRANRTPSQPGAYPYQDNYMNKRLLSFTLFDRPYTPRTWKDLWVTVALEVYRRHSSEFEKAISLRGTRMPYVSTRPQELSEAVQLDKSRYFIETKFSANSIVKRCRELLELFGYKLESLTIQAQ